MSDTNSLFRIQNKRFIVKSPYLKPVYFRRTDLGVDPRNRDGIYGQLTFE